MEYRPLEGFVFAVSPFNFTAIAGNLATAPALMGNTVVWKPSSQSVLSNYYLMQLFEEAGLPSGVINFIPGSGREIGKTVLGDERLAGLHFTGSTQTFQHMWQQIAGNIGQYKNYPRIVGETGGKGYVFMHASAGVEQTAAAIVRAGFEYQGQKCSAASRVYVPRSAWGALKDTLLDMVGKIRVGHVMNFTNFVNAVIDEQAYEKIMGYIHKVNTSKEANIITGGNGDKTEGYYIKPTIVETSDPEFITMQEEIFGPVVTVYVYADEDYESALELCDRTSPYGLTGAVFARDRGAVSLAEKVLTNSAGNFYINDKPSGAVVGQQPFGGSRASGTNDKAGSYLNLTRWMTTRSIKENFSPPSDFRYAFMDEA
jgi:1-pyrroline-5-carboxylate dehydrogenase